ncbi:hypothetical protein AAHA92_28087 [Salvia divinorum]|uniref:Uncharacterized protein n=1 Tax=Salvia divinorum TaxID=28513 RepID=A0ABD1G5T8_SALDI
MGGENGRRLNTNIANLSDNRGKKPTSPYPIVNSERISISESKQQGNERNPTKTAPAPVEPSFRLEKSPTADSSPGSCKDVACDPLVLTETPAIQVMERPKTSDPNTVPTDSPNRWSVDSGDSLFSIHMENGSFSKERSLSISGDMGELSLSEAYLPRVSPKSGDLHQSVKSPYTSPAAAKAIDEARRVVKEDAEPVADQPKCDPPEASISIHTDSNLSRTSESACPVCRCLCCARMCSCSCVHWFHCPSCSRCCISCPSCCSSWVGV